MENQKPGSQMRFTSDELEIIKKVYSGDSGEKLLKLLRKIFLPELDPDAPPGQSIDLWMTIKIDDMPQEEAIINLKARNSVILHLEQQLLQLKILANQTEESAETKAKKIMQDSSK